jgi:hypothetical protein
MSQQTPRATLDSQLQDAITRLYLVFTSYPRPDIPPVCALCGAGVDQARLRHTDLRAWSDADLVAIHVLSLPDDELRYFFPRVLEVLLGDQYAAFEFGLSGLKGRTTDWLPAERDAIEDALTAALEVLLSTYPAAIGYVSSVADLLDLADQLDISKPTFLGIIDGRQGAAADLHVAWLVDFAYTASDHATSHNSAVAPIREWLGRPIIGQRLTDAFYHAGGDATANCLAAAHDLWQLCTPGA